MTGVDLKSLSVFNWNNIYTSDEYLGISDFPLFYMDRHAVYNGTTKLFDITENVSMRLQDVLQGYTDAMAKIREQNNTYIIHQTSD